MKTHANFLSFFWFSLPSLFSVKFGNIHGGLADCVESKWEPETTKCVTIVQEHDSLSFALICLLFEGKEKKEEKEYLKKCKT